jgi:D-galactose 1-dehydrogenase
MVTGSKKSSEAMVAFRIAIIGMGKIAHDQHVPVIAKNPDFELAGVVSQRGIYPNRVRGFRTPAQLFAAIPDLDAVAICTPPSVRHSIARQALAAGKHVLLEKPPTPTLAELFDLEHTARRLKRVLFTSWHSQYNRAVTEAGKRLRKTTIHSLDVQWREDVRRWHPGQEWIWQPGGFGVFDPGINALSIITSIMPSPVFVQSADLFFPSNRGTPIAAGLQFRPAEPEDARLTADFDWRQTGEQTWTITLKSADGTMFHLTKGGARLEVNGNPVVDEEPAEYEAIYRHFAELLQRSESHVDAMPLQLVADAFMLGRRIAVEPFQG